ncbi:hypothetical protein BS50DRAFT_625374 [Corynespora cassiicola Philippines]|uniref:Uncharacterized protein n=1 Tax=Corynespora cassiicola Philippines TaxID=1448308 RepID=A0A2T2N7U1_CORCC|nr:hypothetical protein BS50DRAFT_625374 [Corynespora cassiicola Philippines]
MTTTQSGSESRDRVTPEPPPHNGFIGLATSPSTQVKPAQHYGSLNRQASQPVFVPYRLNFGRYQGMTLDPVPNSYVFGLMDRGGGPAALKKALLQWNDDESDVESVDIRIHSKTDADNNSSVYETSPPSQNVPAPQSSSSLSSRTAYIQTQVHEPSESYVSVCTQTSQGPGGYLSVSSRPNTESALYGPVDLPAGQTQISYDCKIFIQRQDMKWDKKLFQEVPPCARQQADEVVRQASVPATPPRTTPAPRTSPPTAPTTPVLTAPAPPIIKNEQPTHRPLSQIPHQAPAQPESEEDDDDDVDYEPWGSLDSHYSFSFTYPSSTQPSKTTHKTPGKRQFDSISSSAPERLEKKARLSTDHLSRFDNWKIDFGAYRGTKLKDLPYDYAMNFLKNKCDQMKNNRDRNSIFRRFEDLAAQRDSSQEYRRVRCTWSKCIWYAKLLTEIPKEGVKFLYYYDLGFLPNWKLELENMVEERYRGSPGLFWDCEPWEYPNPESLRK